MNSLHQLCLISFELNDALIYLKKKIIINNNHIFVGH